MPGENDAPAPQVTVPDSLGIPRPVYAGAERDPDLDKPTEGDRGDEVVDPTPPVPAPAPEPEPVPPNPTEPEGDDPPEGEDEDEGEGEGEGEDDDRPRDEHGRFTKSVPYSRFKEINDAFKALKSEVEALKSAAPKAPEPEAPEPPAPEYDFDAAEAEYQDLVLDGRKDEAIAKRREIREQERKLFEAQARETTNAVTSEQALKDAITSVADSYVERFEQLNPESENFNEELLDDVKVVYAGVMSAGKVGDPVEAWENSIKKALRMHGIDPDGEPAKPAKTPRTPAARQAAAADTPPVPATPNGGAPAQNDKIDVEKLSLDDLAKLPPGTLERLRGDFV